jgi:hypothetical protein
MALAIAFGCGDTPHHLTGSGPDAALSDASLPCSPISPNCGEGDGCFWAGPGRFECSRALGLPRYHQCRESADCSPGDGCHLDDFVDFYCIGYCNYATHGGQQDLDRCAENEICAEFDGAIGRCLGICDALDPDCPDGLACYAILDAADICLPVLAASPPGEPCFRNNDCVPGSGCIGEREGRCMTYCNYQNNPDQVDPRCEDGEVCSALGDGERLGVCQ